MSLNDTSIKALKPEAKPYKVFDGEGLYIEVLPTGTKVWRIKYRFAKKERSPLTIGHYPHITLRAARDKLREVKDALALGLDPSLEKRQSEAVDATFEVVARDWICRQEKVWSYGYREKVKDRLAKFAFPILGERRIDEITPPEVLSILRRIEGEGKYETAARVLGLCSQVFRYGVACGICTSDPCRDLRGALTSYVETPRAALTKPEDAGCLMAAISEYQGSNSVRAAMLWSAYTFCRPGEVRRAEWSEILWDQREWRIPAEKMKMRVEHRVPLSRQCMTILERQLEWKLSDQWIFPSLISSRPLSENGVLTALRRMGYQKHEMTPHGFRAMASTLLNELGKYREEVIEIQLAHKSKDKVRAIYNRAKYMDERRIMMQEWADYLDGLAEHIRRKRQGAPG